MMSVYLNRFYRLWGWLSRPPTKTDRTTYATQSLFLKILIIMIPITSVFMILRYFLVEDNIISSIIGLSAIILAGVAFVIGRFYKIQHGVWLTVFLISVTTYISLFDDTQSSDGTGFFVVGIALSALMLTPKTTMIVTAFKSDFGCDIAICG